MCACAFGTTGLGGASGGLCNKRSMDNKARPSREAGAKPGHFCILLLCSLDLLVFISNDLAFCLAFATVHGWATMVNLACYWFVHASD